MSEQSRTAPSEHPLKAEIERRGFNKARLALRCDMTYTQLIGRLKGRVPMSPEDESRIRAAMDPDGETGEGAEAAQAAST
jgi:hypothetical protein